jgi:hypothetical protein
MNTDTFPHKLFFFPYTYSNHALDLLTLYHPTLFRLIRTRNLVHQGNNHSLHMTPAPQSHT